MIVTIIGSIEDYEKTKKVYEWVKEVLKADEVYFPETATQYKYPIKMGEKWVGSEYRYIKYINEADIIIIIPKSSISEGDTNRRLIKIEIGELETYKMIFSLNPKAKILIWHEPFDNISEDYVRILLDEIDHKNNIIKKIEEERDELKKKLNAVYGKK